MDNMIFYTDMQNRKWLYRVTHGDKVYIPDDVWGIMPTAFTMVNDISEIYIPQSVREISADTFGCLDDKVTVYCRAETKPRGWADSEQPLNSDENGREMIHNYWLGSAKFTFDANGILTYLPLKYRSGAPKVVWGHK